VLFSRALKGEAKIPKTNKKKKKKKEKRKRKVSTHRCRQLTILP
jgi:hypothetical protein